jgi:hypothetical protein
VVDPVVDLLMLVAFVYTLLVRRKLLAALAPHSKVPEPLSSLKNGKLHSAIFAMNQFNDAILSVSLCTSFLDPRGFM